MRLVEVISNTYEIDDEVLSEFLEYCDKENIESTFQNFIDWFDEQYYFSDFLESDDIDFESINGSFEIERAFQKELKNVLNKEKEND